MPDTIIVALIAGAFGIVSAFISANRVASEADARLQEAMVEMKAQQREDRNITNLKIEQLTEAVNRHNSVIERTTKLETTAELTDAELKRLNKRLEKGGL